MNKLYDERDVMAQGKYYCNHIGAMTREDLRSKSDIAAELAHRDIIIDELVEALEMIADGYSAHDLVGMTGFTEEECQAKIIDILEKAKS